MGEGPGPGTGTGGDPPGAAVEAEVEDCPTKSAKIPKAMAAPAMRAPDEDRSDMTERDYPERHWSG